MVNDALIWSFFNVPTHSEAFPPKFSILHSSVNSNYSLHFINTTGELRRLHAIILDSASLAFVSPSSKLYLLTVSLYSASRTFSIPLHVSGSISLVGISINPCPFSDCPPSLVNAIPSFTPPPSSDIIHYATITLHHSHFTDAVIPRTVGTFVSAGIVAIQDVTECFFTFDKFIRF